VYVLEIFTEENSKSTNDSSLHGHLSMNGSREHYSIIRFFAIW
jgi:hypothetical protein